MDLIHDAEAEADADVAVRAHRRHGAAVIKEERADGVPMSPEDASQTVRLCSSAHLPLDPTLHHPYDNMTWGPPDASAVCRRRPPPLRLCHTVLGRCSTPPPTLTSAVQYNAQPVFFSHVASCLSDTQVCREAW